MTQRYAFALACIALGMLIAYLMIVRQIRASSHDASAINISGRQRMLSQRISLLLQQPGESAVEASRLVTLMRNSQRELSVDDPVDPSLQSSVDALVWEYLADADAHLADGGDSSEFLDRAVAMASSEKLLTGLDDVVTLYQQRAESRVERFRQTEVWLLAAGLFMLLLEVLLIFRPLTTTTQRSLSELETSNGELKEFAYRISHDLRAPVVSSLGILAMAQDSIVDGDYSEIAPALSHLKKSLSRAESTVNDITTLMRLKEATIVPSNVHLAKVLEESIESCSQMEGFDEVQWRVRNLHEPAISVRKEELVFSLQNLLSNAIKYRDRSVESWVRVTAQSRRGEIWIEIEDNGIGIPPQYEDRMFKMFERFHPKVDVGTGLGLYLVAQNAKTLGGSIQYQRSDHGSIFILQFPIA